jgi:hypothetical protein
MDIYDVVRAKVDFNDIKSGTLGTIVHIYKDGRTFEVEFVCNDKVLVETVLYNKVEKNDKTI